MAKATLRKDEPMGRTADGRHTVTIPQAQARCQVSRRTIYNWLIAGKIKYVRTAGGAVRIFEDSLFTIDAPR